jgi:hypothetical protein
VFASSSVGSDGMEDEIAEMSELKTSSMDSTKSLMCDVSAFFLGAAPSWGWRDWSERSLGRVSELSGRGRVNRY